MQEILGSLIVTLNKIEVKGKNNLDMLLGCIQTLEKLREKVKEATENEVDNQQGE